MSNLESTLIYRSFWTQGRLRKLTGEQKGLLLFLLTNSSFNYTGIYKIYSGEIRSRYDGDWGNSFRNYEDCPCEYLCKKYPDTMDKKKKDPYSMPVYQKLNDLCESGNIEFHPEYHTIRIVKIRDFVTISKGIKGFSGNAIATLKLFNKARRVCEPIEFFDHFIEENANFLYHDFVSSAIKSYEKNGIEKDSPYKLKIVNQILEIVKPKSVIRPVESTVVRKKQKQQEGR